MPKHSVRLMLSASLITAFLICCSGCSSEEAEVPSVNDASVTETPEEASKETVPAADTAKAEAEKAPPPETATGSTATMTETPDLESADDVLPEDIVLLSQLWETHTRGAVKLKHKNHVETHKISCRECHHIYKDGKNVWDEGMPVAKCETCHDELTVKGENKLPPDVQKKNLKLAFHDNCRGCHKKIKKENPETKAPLKCTECHEKKT